MRQLTKLKEKLINVALSSEEFKEALIGASEEILDNAKTAENEATIEGLFERVIYAILRDIGINFNPQKEVRIETRIHFGKGRADSRIGGVLIEYKHRSKLRTIGDISSAQNQIKEYLLALSQKNENELIGFLTDGLSIYEIHAINGKIISSSGKLNINEANLLNFIRTIVLSNQSALTPENLIRDFCGSNNDGVLFEVARILNDILDKKPTQKTIMLISEWSDLFSLVHNEQSQQKRIEERKLVLSMILKRRLDDSVAEAHALFSLHTAYAIVLKLLAYRIISDIEFGSPLQNYRYLIYADSRALQSFCSDLEDGEIFRKLGILNLLEGDFFSWYADKNQWNEELSKALQKILETLSRYEDISKVFSTSTAIDLFRELYEATVPQVVRATFGEFYTPFWLAEQVLETSTPSGKWRVLDPACGSGTFIIAATDRIRKENIRASKEQVLTEILTRVAGIDLNPLAVLTSRVNLFIHIADLLPKKLENLIIPIYLGDSSYVPEKSSLSGVPTLRYKLRTLMGPIDIELPISLVRNSSKFVKLMYEYEKLVKKRQTNKASALLIDALDKEEINDEVRSNIIQLTMQLIALEQKEWNGIWARIITNFLTIGCFDKFSCIIGNPPWIDWKNLPSGYRDKIKSLCIDKGLFSGAGRTGGINLNICALITHVAISNWLKDDGKLAFLMPKELAYQPSYEGWRDMVGGNTRTFIEFDDWSKAGNPFFPVTEDFMTFVIGESKNKNNRNIIPVVNYIKKKGTMRPKNWSSIEDAIKTFDIIQGYAGQIIHGSTIFTFTKTKEDLRLFERISGECNYLGREGIEFYPQELLIFEYDGEAPKDGTVFVKNIQVQKSKYHIPEQRLMLETKYLYPLIRGRSIDKFAVENEEVFVPFPYNQGYHKKPIDMDKLEERSGLLLSYYKKYQKIIAAQTKYSDKIRGTNSGEFYGLARVGPYTFRTIHVAFRDNTKWCAAVVKSKKTPWGETKGFLFQNHAVSICERADTSEYITEDEAHYICAILNAPIVEKFIYSTADMRSFKIRPPVFIPRYDSKNKVHTKLSELSKLAHSKGITDKLLADIDLLYMKICEDRELKNQEQASLK